MAFKQSLGQTKVTSLVERASRFTVLLKNTRKRNGRRASGSAHTNVSHLVKRTDPLTKNRGAHILHRGSKSLS